MGRRCNHYLRQDGLFHEKMPAAASPASGSQWAKAPTELALRIASGVGIAERRFSRTDGSRDSSRYANLSLPIHVPGVVPNPGWALGQE